MSFQFQENQVIWRCRNIKWLWNPFGKLSIFLSQEIRWFDEVPKSRMGVDWVRARGDLVISEFIILYRFRKPEAYFTLFLRNKVPSVKLNGLVSRLSITIGNYGGLITMLSNMAIVTWWLSPFYSKSNGRVAESNCTRCERSEILFLLDIPKISR